MNSKQRRLRKGRCIAVLAIIFALAGFLGDVFHAVAADNLPTTGNGLQRIVVTQGDTLWGLVDRYYQYDGDIRSAIYEVQKINGRSDSKITPGEIIYLPAIENAGR